MHLIITRYAGTAGEIGAAAPKVQQGFVPMLKGQPGFQGYAAFASEQGDIIAVAKTIARPVAARGGVGATAAAFSGSTCKNPSCERSASARVSNSATLAAGEGSRSSRNM